MNKPSHAIDILFFFPFSLTGLSFFVKTSFLINKSQVDEMTDKLPPNLLKLFAPRPPLSYTPPLDKDPEKRVGCLVDGVASVISQLKDHNVIMYLGSLWKRSVKRRLK
ncbi:unnamed protein product [Mucor hiemalis]